VEILGEERKYTN